MSALALCCEINPNLCLLRLSLMQHNAPAFHDTTETAIKARGGPGLLGMPKMFREPCRTPTVPPSHSNRRKAYVSGSYWLAKRFFALFTREKQIYIRKMLHLQDSGIMAGTCAAVPFTITTAAEPPPRREAMLCGSGIRLQRARSGTPQP